MRLVQFLKTVFAERPRLGELTTWRDFPLLLVVLAGALAVYRDCLQAAGATVVVLAGFTMLRLLVRRQRNLFAQTEQQRTRIDRAVLRFLLIDSALIIASVVGVRVFGAGLGVQNVALGLLPFAILAACVGDPLLGGYWTVRRFTTQRTDVIAPQQQKSITAG